MSEKAFMRDNLLLILTVVSVFGGCIFGFTLRNLNLTQKNIDLIGFPGEIFMNMLKVCFKYQF